VVTSTSVTVPDGTAEGNAGIICLLAQAIIAAPSQWDLVANPSPGFGIAIMCRSDLPAGETSWPFSTAAGACNWAWTAGEWSNTAPAPLESSAPGGFSSAPASQSTGSTGTFSAQYVMGVAAFGLSNAGTGAVWPSFSYDNSFTETDSVQIGTGTAAGDLLLKVARRYGTDSDAGPWSCTATFTGSMTGKTAYATLAVFRAEETASPPLPVMTS
jgi:hypothetical protein